ncbi:MAG: ribosome silencing factor [Planctomycetota bacterium]
MSKAARTSSKTKAPGKSTSRPHTKASKKAKKKVAKKTTRRVKKVVEPRSPVVPAAQVPTELSSLMTTATTELKPRTTTTARAGRMPTRDFAIEAARVLFDDKCTDIVLLDVSAVSSVTDFIIIGSGTSDRQMKSTLGDVAELARSVGHEVVRRSIDDRATWVLADFVDVVVHLFEPNTRAYYDLEMLWGEVPRIDWERSEAPRRAQRAVKAE